MIPTTSLEPLLAIAQELADAADEISLARWRAHDLRVDTKPDLSPVTEADQAIERLIRDRVARDLPDHHVVGEEYGGDLAAADEWRWIVDPIDGTKAFVRGNETWATLIALQHRGETVVAVASAAALRERFHAIAGGGAFLNGRRISCSAIDNLGEALIAHTSIAGFIRVGLDTQLRGLARQCWEATGLGNAMSHLAVARGSADIGWTSRANVWDYASLSLIVREAGGRFLDRSADGPLGGTGLSANPRLFDRVMAQTGLQFPEGA